MQAAGILEQGVAHAKERDIYVKDRLVLEPTLSFA